MLYTLLQVDTVQPAGTGEGGIYVLVYVGLALTAIFFTSILEAVLLSSSPATLAERKAAGSRWAGVLLDLKQNNLDDAISAILTLSTVTNTFGAAMAGAEATAVYGTSEGIFAGILTLLVLVFSEIIPKTIGAQYATALAPFAGWCIAHMVLAMRPVLVLTRSLTRMFTRGERKQISRDEIEAFIDLATTEGALGGHEQQMFSNLLRFAEIHVSDVMTPRTVVEMLPISTTIAEFLSNRRVQVFSRIPLYGDNFDDVRGYIFTRDVYQDIAKDVDRSQLVSTYQRPVWFIPELASIDNALKQFLERGEHIAIALDEHGGVSGLVSFEDIVETIFGVDIVDEADRVADLRKVAATLRDRRHERMRARGQLAEVEEKSAGARE